MIKEYNSCTGAIEQESKLCNEKHDDDSKFLIISDCNY